METGFGRWHGNQNTLSAIPLSHMTPAFSDQLFTPQAQIALLPGDRTSTLSPRPASGTWIERARASLIASFASGVARDEAAVRAAITSSWSNGQTEGQITRLKLVRRQMYGRGKIDLLQARLIDAE
jgi:hypothetical protein